MAKNESLPARLQEKYSRGDDRLTLYERHEEPITYRSRPSLSNPRSTNDIVRAVLRANPTLLRSATNRDPTTSIVENMVTLVKKFKQKQGKLKNKLNISKIDDSDKEDFIRILESRSSNSSDNDVLTSIDSNYHYDR